MDIESVIEQFELAIGLINQSGKDWLDERDIPVLEKAIEVCKKEVPKLTADDIETIRIHLNAFKENLCNQCRWNEAKEYEDLIDRLLSTSSAQPERKTGKWLIRKFGADAQCSECKMFFSDVYDMENSDAYCRHCGAKMEGLRRVKDESDA